MAFGYSRGGPVAVGQVAGFALDFGVFALEGADPLKAAIRKARTAALVYEEVKPVPAVKGKPVIWMKAG